MALKNSYYSEIDKVDKSKKIFVAGHLGMVGRAICKYLNNYGFNNLIVADRSKLNLLNQDEVLDFFKTEDIDQVYLAAAKVGGINANSAYPAEFIFENIMIQTNIISAAHKCSVEKLLFLGSSCIYPAHVSQPMKEDALLSGALEATNQSYAIAKISGIEMCRAYNLQYGSDFRCIMPTNLYGQNDNFHPENSHVIPSLIQKFYQASEQKIQNVEVWGTGLPKREFLHVDDLAEASIFIMNLKKEIFFSSLHISSPHINVGSGVEITINELVEILVKVSGYQGKVFFNSNFPDGVQRKLLDSSIISKLGWKPNISLEEGLLGVYNWFSENQSSFRKY